MKKINLLLILCFAMNTASGQDYIPMLENDHIWNAYSVGCPDPCIEQYWEFYIDGEEVLGGQTSKIVRFSNFACYLREDNGLVYSYDFSANSEVLIYDFTLEIGDVYVFPDPVCYEPIDRPFEEMIVVDVTTEFIADEMRKVIYFEDTIGSGTQVEYWIEGIGSSTGLMPGGQNSLDSGMSLTCFTENGNTYYFNGFTICFQLGIDDYSLDSIFVYPNPAGENANMNLPFEFNINTVRIIDISGRTVTELSVDSETVNINTSMFDSGLYVYQALNQNKVIKTNRFVVK